MSVYNKCTVDCSPTDMFYWLQQKPQCNSYSGICRFICTLSSSRLNVNKVVHCKTCVWNATSITYEPSECWRSAEAEIHPLQMEPCRGRGMTWGNTEVHTCSGNVLIFRRCYQNGNRFTWSWCPGRGWRLEQLLNYGGHGLWLCTGQAEKLCHQA